jgi:tetratricopeptide (TPR) repeat protein
MIAWLHRRAGRLDEAARFYAMALARSPGSIDARLGLASLEEAQGRCEEARDLYDRLLADLPDLAAARAGLARCAPAPAARFTPSVSLAGTYYPNHPVKAFSAGVTAGAELTLRSGWSFSATYRYTHFFPASLPPPLTISPWDEHDGYFSAGWGAPLGGLTLHYAVVYDGSGFLGTSHHVGMTVRWSPFGDIEIRAAGSLYDDLLVGRVEPSWRIPIAGGLSVRPGVALADAGGELLATGLFTLALDRPHFSLWAGGKYGDEVRPVYWTVPIVYATPERIPFGAWAGASVNVNDDVRIHLTYAMDRLKQTDGTQSDAHTLAVGTAISF